MPSQVRSMNSCTPQCGIKCGSPQMLQYIGRSPSGRKSNWAWTQLRDIQRTMARQRDGEDLGPSTSAGPPHTLLVPSTGFDSFPASVEDDNAACEFPYCRTTKAVA